MSLPRWPINRLRHFDQRVWGVPHISQTCKPGFPVLVDDVDAMSTFPPRIWVLLPVRVDPAIDVRMWTYSWVPQIAGGGPF